MHSGAAELQALEDGLMVIGHDLIALEATWHGSLPDDDDELCHRF